MATDEPKVLGSRTGCCTGGRHSEGRTLTVPIRFALCWYGGRLTDIDYRALKFYFQRLILPFLNFYCGTGIGIQDPVHARQVLYCPDTPQVLEVHSKRERESFWVKTEPCCALCKRLCIHSNRQALPITQLPLFAVPGMV